MSICRVQLHICSNVLTLGMSGEQMRLQVQPKLFGVNSWIPDDQAVNDPQVKLHGTQLTEQNSAAFSRILLFKCRLQ